MLRSRIRAKLHALLSISSAIYCISVIIYLVLPYETEDDATSSVMTSLPAGNTSSSMCRPPSPVPQHLAPCTADPDTFVQALVAAVPPPRWHAPDQCPPNPRSWNQSHLPLTALLGHAGSGHEWIQHLLQTATGVFTGSRPDAARSRHMSPRHHDDLASGLVVVMTHTTKYSTDMRNRNYRRRRKRSKDPKSAKADRFDKHVLIVRNPYDSIWAAYIQKNGKISRLKHPDIFNESHWLERSAQMVDEWIDVNRSWLANASRPLYLVRYERWRKHPELHLNNLLTFLGWAVSERQLGCARRHSANVADAAELGPMSAEPFSRQSRQKLAYYLKLIDDWPKTNGKLELWYPELYSPPGVDRRKQSQKLT